MSLYRNYKETEVKYISRKGFLITNYKIIFYILINTSFVYIIRKNMIVSVKWMHTIFNDIDIEDVIRALRLNSINLYNINRMLQNVDI